ncbi:hypothetical protein C1J03_22915 [Sulfitobacter sp. SK012]|uniref:hypothetical protein n=1 Tax=Sulfitobacter sp. SK012 TaxID=1389005 RepID=UPI000E0A8E17|nr:hypothetical protein [Sulfitobacter sp. SK012]AXI48596.1 hypothetical protein C1J03_22915 [Sulfitobacter sp. SK012]
MSSISHRYKDFTSIARGPEEAEIAKIDILEEKRLQIFEDGYQAGWVDAINAHQTDQTNISVDFAQNLQDMSFTYHEALMKLTNGLQPLFGEILHKLLPQLAANALGGHVLEQLSEITSMQMEGTATITVAPENYDAVQALLEQNEAHLPFALKSESNLSAGQVYIRLGLWEREINLDEVTDGIAKAVSAFFHQTKSETPDD